MGTFVYRNVSVSYLFAIVKRLTGRVTRSDFEYKWCHLIWRLSKLPKPTKLTAKPTTRNIYRVYGGTDRRTRYSIMRIVIVFLDSANILSPSDFISKLTEYPADNQKLIVVFVYDIEMLKISEKIKMTIRKHDDNDSKTSW